MDASLQNVFIALLNYEDSELSAAVGSCNFSLNFSISFSLHLEQMLLNSSDSAKTLVKSSRRNLLRMLMQNWGRVSRPNIVSTEDQGFSSPLRS